MCDFGGKNLLRSVYFVKGLQLCMYKATHCFFKKNIHFLTSISYSRPIYYRSPLPGPIRALAAGGIILDNYIMNMITCSKTRQIPVKNASWTQTTWNLSTFQRKTLQFPETKKLALKKLQFMFKLRTFCVKNAPSWLFQKLHGKSNMQVEAQHSANNGNNISIQIVTRHWVLNFKARETCTGTKNKILNCKVHQTCTETKNQSCTGTKNQKN